LTKKKGTQYITKAYTTSCNDDLRTAGVILRFHEILSVQARRQAKKGPGHHVAYIFSFMPLRTLFLFLLLFCVSQAHVTELIPYFSKQQTTITKKKNNNIIFISFTSLYDSTPKFSPFFSSPPRKQYHK
jgi:hypothetical protein